MSDERREIYAKSELTGNYYRVNRWEDLGDGQVKAKDKTQVDREEVPEEWLERLDDE